MLWYTSNVTLDYGFKPRYAIFEMPSGGWNEGVDSIQRYYGLLSNVYYLN